MLLFHGDLLMERNFLLVLACLPVLAVCSPSREGSPPTEGKGDQAAIIAKTSSGDDSTIPDSVVGSEVGEEAVYIEAGAHRGGRCGDGSYTYRTTRSDPLAGNADAHPGTDIACFRFDRYNRGDRVVIVTPPGEANPRILYEQSDRESIHGPGAAVTADQ